QAVVLLDVEPDELEGVVLVLARRRQLRAWHGELGPARRCVVEPDHRPAAGALRGDHLGRLAIDVQGCTDREAPRVLARLLDAERPVEPVRLADAPDADELRQGTR